MAPRDIDHLVVAVRSLADARAAYSRLGFTVAPPARHPFGTANSVIQLGGNYLELLAIEEPGAISPATDTRFSFAAFNREYLEHREGVSMLALHSEDAGADRAAFEKRHLPVYEPLRFERQARGPDSVERAIGFAVTFTSDARVHGGAGFFTCQHLHPENFWRSEYQRHANGALLVESVVFVTRDPADFHEFLTYFTGQHEMLATSLHVRFALGVGAVDVMSPVGFHAYFGEDAGPDPRRFTGYRIAVADVSETRKVLTTNRVPFTERMGALVVPSTYAHGAAVAFIGRDAIVRAP